MATDTRSTPGIVVRHGRNCTTRTGARCNCDPSYEPWVYSKRDRKKIRPEHSFPTLAAAKGWRIDAMKEVRDKRLRAATPRTLRQEVDEWLEGARAGRILNKRERTYKPAVIRNYELSLRLRVLPRLGDRKLADVDLADLLELKEELLGAGSSGSTIRNTFVPLQAIYRRARLMGLVPVDPTVDLPLPTANKRERAATPTAARDYLALLPESVRPLWATAFYAGLRRGELRALRVSDVSLEKTTIAGKEWPPHLRVERGWDDKEGAILPKSVAGLRRVSLLDELRLYLEPLVTGRGGDELVFGAGTEPFDPRAVARRAQRALDAVDKAHAEAAEEAGEDPPEPVERFGLHEARHSFSTWMDHAGINETRADRYMGHAPDGVAGQYRHLLPSQIADDAATLGAYLAGAATGKVVALASAR
jgi:integrase